MREKITPPNDVITKYITLRGPGLRSATLPEVSSNTFGLVNPRDVKDKR